MRAILAGIETEYGLHIDGRGASTQVEDSQALVRAYPDECFVGWDYRFENPRADLRGFNLEHLAFDPVDAKFDAGKSYGSSVEIRSDRILPNGARFYNDHGHPEYSTPECYGLHELARQDVFGQSVVLRAAQSYGHGAQLYKNNTDFHGASYGTHESYLVPRDIGYERLFHAVLPMLIARQILTGAGKVGSEAGAKAPYQLSQRADFFAEPANTETLYKRPIFNTRDEPHSDPTQWIRLHVISGDANMIANATARKVGLVKLAIALAENGQTPVWRIKDPVATFQHISRDLHFAFRVELEGSWTTAYEILESYFSAAEATLELDDELKWLISSSRFLLEIIQNHPFDARREIDWVAKKWMIESFMNEEGLQWDDPSLQAYDLEYHNIDPDHSLHQALVEMGEVGPNESSVLIRPTDTRAFARGLAIEKYSQYLLTASWSGLVLKVGADTHEIYLPPEGRYPVQLAHAEDVGSFIEMLRGVK